MSETPTTPYDPADHTVDQVNDYLAAYKADTDNPDAYQDAREAVLAAEHDGKARGGILNGPHAFDGGTPAEPDKRTAQQNAAAETGVWGDVAGPDDPHAVKPADQSAPDDVPEAGTVGTPDGLTTDAPATIQDQEAPTLEGDHYQRGYVGDLPDADNRPDLTLAGVLGRNQSATDTTED